MRATVPAAFCSDVSTLSSGSISTKSTIFPAKSRSVEGPRTGSSR